MEMKDENMNSLDVENDVEITLVSEDAKICIPRSMILCSKLVKTMLEGEKDNLVIPLPSVDFTSLQKIVEFVKFYHVNPLPEIVKPLKTNQLIDAVPKWYADFVDSMPLHDLMNLLHAANYMNIQPLLDLICCKIASMIKGKTTEEIRQTFNIVNDFTPEEEANVIAENKWVEEN